MNLIQEEIKKFEIFFAFYVGLYKVNPMTCLHCHRTDAEVQLQPIRNLGARRRWVASTAPRPLSHWDRPVPIVQEAGWAPGPLRTGTENLASTGISSPARPDRSEN